MADSPTLAMCLAHRAILLCLLDALPVHEKIVMHDRLLALVAGRAPIPGVIPRTTTATEVRAELDHYIPILQRSAMTSLAL